MKNLSKILKNYPLLPLFLALVVSLSLQLATISKWSVWHDEGFTAMLIDNNPSEIIRRTAIDVHPPLYYLVLKAWGSVLGHSDVTLRLFSTLCMLLVIVMTYGLVQKLFGTKSARWALIPLSVAPVIIRYGQEMRMYGLATLLGVTSTYLLVVFLQGRRTLRRPQKRLILAAYIILATAIIYTHYFAGFLLLVHWAMVLGDGYDRRLLSKSPPKAFRELFGRDFRWWITANVAIIVLFLPWLGSFLEQTRSVESGFWISPVSAQSFIGTIATFVIFRPIWIAWQLTGWYAVWSLLVFGLVVLIYRHYWQTHRSWLKRAVGVGYFALPALILFALSLPPRTSVYYDRYMVTFSPLFYAGLGIGMGWLYERMRRKTVTSAIALMAVVVFLGYGVVNVERYGNNFGRPDDQRFSMRELVEQWRPQYSAGDVVIAQDLGQYFNFRFYTKDFAGEPLLYTEKQLGKYGNNSLVYDRPELLVSCLSSIHTSGVIWLVMNSMENDFIKNKLPVGWQFSGISYRKGDAVIAGYIQ